MFGIIYLFDLNHNNFLNKKMRVDKLLNLQLYNHYSYYNLALKVQYLQMGYIYLLYPSTNNIHRYIKSHYQQYNLIFFHFVGLKQPEVIQDNNYRISNPQRRLNIQDNPYMFRYNQYYLSVQEYYLSPHNIEILLYQI